MFSQESATEKLFVLRNPKSVVVAHYYWAPTQYTLKERGWVFQYWVDGKSRAVSFILGRPPKFRARTFDSEPILTEEAFQVRGEMP